MRILLCLPFLLAVLVIGCGGDKPLDPAKTKPFRDAIVEYLRVGTMDMKPEEFESLEIGDTLATAKVRMMTKDDLYGLKTLWTFTFHKDAQGRWQVRKAER